MKGRIRRSALLRKQLLAFTRVLPALEKGDGHALHRARVASRRLRELIPVLQVDARTARKLNRRTRKVTRRLGALRELDVLLLLIDELYVSRPAYRDALKRVSHLVRKARDEQRRSMLERLPIDDLWALARRFEHALDTVRQGEETVPEERRAPRRARTVEWAIDARIVHRMARLAAALESAGGVYLPERLHAVRVTLKKARYAFELKAGQDRRSPALQTMKRMQELLGRMHDLQVLIDWVREAQASLAPPNLAVWRELDALVLMLDESCRRLHARYLREREALRSVCANITPQEAGRRSERRVG